MIIAPSLPDLLESKLVFILDLEWDGRDYRFSSYPISMNDESGAELFFSGGLSDPIWSEKSNLLGFEVEADTIPIELVFDDKNMAKLRMQGHTIEFAKGVLACVTERAGSVLETFEKRTILFSGKVIDPIVGDPEFPAGYVSFSLEQGRDVVSSPLLKEASSVTRSGFTSPRDSALGKQIPFVFGLPGARLPSGAGATFAESAQFATPGILYGSTIIVIAAHVVNASQVTVQDKDGTSVVKAVTKSTDNLGNPISLIDISATALDTLDGPSAEYWIKWSAADGGGIINPFGPGELDGAGDIIRYALLQVDAEIDWQAWNSAAALLNGYKFSGYVNEPVEALEWLENVIFPFIPCEMRPGAGGLRPLIAMLYAPIYQRPILSIESGPDFYVSSGITPQSGPDEIANWIVLRFGYVGSMDKLASVAEVDPRVSSANFGGLKFSTVHAEISRNRYGLRRREYEADFINEISTAARVSADLARINGLPLISIQIQASIRFGYLMLGDLIELTHSGLGLSNHLCQILAKSFNGSGFEFELALEESPHINKRVTT